MRVKAEYASDVIHRNWKTGLNYGHSMCPEVEELLKDLIKTYKWYWGDTWGACFLTRKEQFIYRPQKHVYHAYSKKAVFIIYAYGTKYPQKIGSKKISNGDICRYSSSFVCFDKILALRTKAERKRKLQKLNSL